MKGQNDEKALSITLCAAFILRTVLGGCGKKAEVTSEVTSTFQGPLRLLNTKSEVNEQIKELAQLYEKETGIKVEVLAVGADVDAQATLKGYYLSDQMPDIISCEAAGFSNWEGLLVDMSDQDWVSRTDAANVDVTYGTIGFPFTTEAIGLAYNAAILDKCGIDPESITSLASLKEAFEVIDSKKDYLGLKGVVGYCSEPENLGWSSGNHIFGAYLDSGLDRTDTTYIDKLNDGGQLDTDRFAHFADMIGLFIQYSDPDLLIDGTYTDQVLNFSSGKYAFITQGSWIGVTMTGDNAAQYQAAGSFEVGMIPYVFEDNLDTILTSAPSWWAVPKEGNVEAAEAFLQWCSEDSAQQVLVEKAGFISPFKDCRYVASDHFAAVISNYIATGTSIEMFDHMMLLTQHEANLKSDVISLYDQTTGYIAADAVGTQSALLPQIEVAKSAIFDDITALNNDFTAYNNETVNAQLSEITAQYKRLSALIDSAIEKCDAGDRSSAYTILFDKAEIQKIAIFHSTKTLDEAISESAATTTAEMNALLQSGNIVALIGTIAMLILIIANFLISYINIVRKIRSISDEVNVMISSIESGMVI